MKKASQRFYEREAIVLAKDLIGCVLVHRLSADRMLRARIVETEAYVGEHDLASHASRGRTRRTEVMFGPAGRAYVYFIYGMHEMFNIVCGVQGDAQAVLIRAAEPLDGWVADLSGPGKLARAFQITRAHNALDLGGDELYVLHGPAASGRRVVTTRRVGVDYAKQWKDRPLRFLDADSQAVSKPKFA
jgi:DNA-3-methyladenine glycosylase